MLNKKAKTNETYADATLTEVMGFQTFYGNRLINRLHVQTLAKQMADGGLQYFPPITINRITNHILDGQHRVEAFKLAIEKGMIPRDSTLRVMYIECPEEIDEREKTVDMQNSKGWTLDDFVSSYATTNEEYAKLQLWCKEHPKACMNGVTKDKNKKWKYKYRFAAAVIKGESCQKMLKNGSFVASEDEYSLADVVYDEIERLFQIIKCESKPSALEWVAIHWHQVRKLHSPEEWQMMFKKKRDRIQKMPKDGSKDWEAIFSLVSTAIDKQKQEN